MNLEGYFIYFSGHGVRMYRSTEMCKSNKCLYNNDVTFSEKGQTVIMYRSENLLPLLATPYYKSAYLVSLFMVSLDVPILGILIHCIFKIPQTLFPLLLLSPVQCAPPKEVSILISAHLGVCSFSRYPHLSFPRSPLALPVLPATITFSPFHICKEPLQCVTMSFIVSLVNVIFLAFLS